MSTVKLRPAGVADEAVLLELARAFHAEDGHPLTKQGVAAIGQVARGHPLGRAWLIEEAGHVIGYTILCLGFGIEYGGPDAFVDDLYLVSQARGRGIGRIVLELLQGEARSQGLAALFLVVDPDNWRARRLYDRAGFEGSNWLLMAKRL